jgi:hypothetical protein
VGETQLRTAGIDYPESIRNRFLALPDSIPPRVMMLAREITAAATTPYDRARAIESYLRAFPYTLDLPAPPPKRDVADYFLFDLQKGYCDYYATAMVVLARAANLPARLVTGYATGSYDIDTARYTITEADAHSWVEVYFPAYGWVEFEPTGGRPPIERPVQTEATPTFENGALTPGGGRTETGTSPVWWPTLLWGLGGAVAAAFAWQMVDRIRLGRMTPSQTIHVLYRRLTSHAGRLSVSTTVGDTPYEFADTFVERLVRLTQTSRLRSALNPAIDETRWLVTLYVRACYSPHPPERVEQKRAVATWGKLKWRLWSVRFL